MKTSVWSERDTRLRRWGILAAAIITLLAVLSGPSAAQKKAQNHTATFEQTYMRNMMDLNASGMLIAQMAQRKAVHRDLRNLAQGMILSQKNENQQLRTWLASWYGVKRQSQIRPQDRQMLNTLRNLSGKEFETRCLTYMINHENEAVTMSRQALQRAEHRDLRNFAQKVINERNGNLTKMHNWQRTWYSSR
ncbi:MAG TPA: DUF305 domain-containing protein [Armatimonadota bacterium]|nr:DUF305 domain-containing protein [Armatimonadota bacterium]